MIERLLSSECDINFHHYELTNRKIINLIKKYKTFELNKRNLVTIYSKIFTFPSVLIQIIVNYIGIDALELLEDYNLNFFHKIFRKFF